MKIYVKDRYKSDLTPEVIDDILRYLGLVSDHTIQYISGNGRNIIIDTGEKLIYVIVSSKYAADSRNAFLSQYVPTVLGQYIEDARGNKERYVYLMDTSRAAITPFIVDGYRVLKTLGINILNEKALGIEVDPYKTFDEWKNAKTVRQQANLSNQSTFAIEDENGNGYTVFGKLYGANGKDATLIACMLAYLAKKENKKLTFVEVKEHDTENVSATDRKVLEHYGVDLGNGSIVRQSENALSFSTCRKQDEFKYNLLQKYKRKKCYLCECDIESAVIASHIHRITDIDSSDLSDDEKRRQAVDANNGFWLCATHDKLFEYGSLTFDLNGKLALNPSLTQEQIEFIERITDNREIDAEHKTAALMEYLAKHNRRVSLGE